MQESERAQIRLIVDDGIKLALREIDQRIAGILSANAAKGMLRSGVTIQQTVDAVATTTIKSALILCESVKRINSSPEAFELLNGTVMAQIGGLEERCVKVVKTVSGRPASAANPSMLKVCGNLFEQFKNDLTTKLEIERFQFFGAPPKASAQIEPTPAPKKGGRPPAEFWDDLWAHIAAALYNGDLAPKRQSEIEAAMADWLDDKNFSASPSTIRGRARRLWDLIESAEN